MLSNALRKETLPAPSFFVIFLLKFPYMREYMRETAANFSPPSAHLPRHAPLDARVLLYYNENNKIQMELYVRQGTKLSKDLLASGIKIMRFAW